MDSSFSSSEMVPVRPECGTVTASLAALGRVEVAPVGFQHRFDLLQDIALLQGQPTPSCLARSIQEQVGYLQPQRRFCRKDHRQFLEPWARVFVLFHVVHPSLYGIRLRTVRPAVGERRSDRAKDAKAPEKSAHRRQWPGDQARKTGAEQRCPE